MSDFEKNVDFISGSVYDGSNKASDGGAVVTAKEAILAALKETGKTQVDATASIGWLPQKLSGKFLRNTLRADEFLELLDAIGVDVILQVRETGRIVKARIAGAGRRVRKMVNGVIYDTAESDALANNFYADGVNEYSDGRAIELYLDREGRYFFAEYTNIEGVKDRIIPVSGEDAAEFITKYGTKIHKGPTE